MQIINLVALRAFRRKKRSRALRWESMVTGSTDPVAAATGTRTGEE